MRFHHVGSLAFSYCPNISHILGIYPLGQLHLNGPHSGYRYHRNQLSSRAAQSWYCIQDWASWRCGLEGHVLVRISLWQTALRLLRRRFHQPFQPEDFFHFQLVLAMEKSWFWALAAFSHDTSVFCRLLARVEWHFVPMTLLLLQRWKVFLCSFRAIDIGKRLIVVTIWNWVRQVVKCRKYLMWQHRRLTNITVGLVALFHAEHVLTLDTVCSKKTLDVCFLLGVHIRCIVRW